LKDIFFIVLFFILIYLGASTILGDSGLMGSYGAEFASFNQFYLGYISFVYIFVLLVPLYYIRKNSMFDFRRAEITIASTLLFFSLLQAQAMLISNEFRGKVAADFVDFLSPYIGVFGIWIFWLIITLISLVILLDKTIQELSSSVIEWIKTKYYKFQGREVVVKKVTKSFDTEYTTPKVEKEEPKVEPVNELLKEEVFESKTEINEEKEPFKVEESIEEIDEDSIDTPTYLRQQNLSEKPKKEETQQEETQPIVAHNIIELASKVKEQKSTLIVEELEENTKLLDAIDKGEVEKPKNFKLPSIDFLQKSDAKKQMVDENELDDKIGYLIEKLAHFKIDGDVVRTYAGPVVSTFEFKPAANVKVSKILNLQDDLAMALSAETIRIQAPIPGKDVVGIEIPNDSFETIYMREILESKLFQESASPLTLALGKDIVGKPFITDLKKLPHLLIAGTTGSGKSVGINAMILSLLYKNSPDQLRLLMIDPKMLEFSTYNDIPHLLTPVITKPKQAIVALNNMVAEMERRYELMADSRTKNIENYNEKVKSVGGEHFPYIVVIIDELADLMMTSGKDVEFSIARLAQKSRACGIHLVVATQRPSVDVVTGLIKANLPSRISYRVGQKIDSKIILDQMGAESLLGRGDMLFTPPGSTGLVRLHAPWTTESEIEEIVEFIKSQREPNYDKSFLVEESEESSGSSRESYEELDELYEEAKNVILTDKKTSISYLQRKLQIGYNRSARLIEQLEGEGVLSAPNTKGIRVIL
jgi:S-DNA-T family DNA segregation ATPase FtsK/SpoIIIE